MTGSKTIFGDKDIYSLLSLAKEKVGGLLVNTCSTLQSNNYNSIPKHIMGYCMFILAKGTKKNGYLDRQWYDHTNIMKNGLRKVWQTKMGTWCCKEVG
jgi:hypothetical protein